MRRKGLIMCLIILLVAVQVPISAADLPGVKNEIVLEENNLILPVKAVKKYPIKQEDYENILLYMMENELETYTLDYNSEMCKLIESGELQKRMKAAYHKVFGKYIEDFAFTEGFSIDIKGNTKSGKATLKLNVRNINGKSLKVIKEEYFNGCKNIIMQLMQQGKLSSRMSDTQKARVLYEWMVLNLQYDTNASTVSFTGYGALVNKKAVCQGYTAMYNTLCKLVGIKAEGIIGKAGKNANDHSWTLVTLDGKETFIDVTFGDPLPDRKGVCSFNYFDVSAQTLSRDHIWEE